FLSTPAAAPIVLGLVVGLLLLLSVVATGFASAAGLLAVGAMSLVSIVLAAVPPAALRGVRRPPVDGSRRGRRRLRLRPPAHPPRAHRGPRASPRPGAPTARAAPRPVDGRDPAGADRAA